VFSGNSRRFNWPTHYYTIPYIHVYIYIHDDDDEDDDGNIL